MWSWLFSYWSILIWAAPLLIGLVIVRLYLGQRVALPLMGFVIVFIIYLIGRKNGRDNYDKIAKDIEEKREVEYEKIDKRNTSASDVSDRLRNGSY